MEGETRAVRDNSGLINAHPISVLVVDDDTTCLAIIAAKLKKFQYHVVTVKHPNEALCTLRFKAGTFHLVVTDVHMPDMSGIQLQQVIAREFNLPVVLMSADKKEDVVLEGLESGAAFYIAKPVSADDLKDLWQFAITKKKKSNVVIEETGCSTHEIITSSNQTNISDAVGGNASSMNEIARNVSSMNEIAASTSSVNEVSHDHNNDTMRKSHNKDSKRKSPQEEESSGKNKEISETDSQKKKKVVWTNSLHNRFLDAIHSIGLERAVPKKILEVMNVPTLTRENVASHLQKYRIFLRRVFEDANVKIRLSEKSSIRRSYSPIFTPSIGSSSSNPFLSNLTRFRSTYPGLNLGAKNASFQNRVGSSSDMLGQPRYRQTQFLSNGGSMLAPNPETFVGARNAFFLNQEGSSSNVLGQFRLGQSRLLSNEGSMLNPNAVGTNRTTDNESTGLVQNIYQNSSAVQGHISGALSPHFDPRVLGSTSGANLEISDYGFSNSYMHNGTINPTFNPSSSTMLKDCARPMNYVGLDISNVQQLLAKAAAKQPASDGRINNLACNLEFQNSTTVGTAPGPSESPAINVDQWLDDFLAQECQTPVHPNEENGLFDSTWDAAGYSPMFDLDELTNLPLEQECNLNPLIPTSTCATVNVQDFNNNVSSFNHVVNVQNQVQDFGNVSAFDQTLNEGEEDDFLESLLAPELDFYEENPNIEGLLD